ncbi:hypothetical protein O3P69_004682 [Scylla paramamosain]|uniref:Uncharacterized protein n=1 Tax=Scylla paramamosain TaxID=85552 RepID=A0AAW0UEM9_SCYPA
MRTRSVEGRQPPKHTVSSAEKYAFGVLPKAAMRPDLTAANLLSAGGSASTPARWAATSDGSALTTAWGNSAGADIVRPVDTRQQTALTSGQLFSSTTPEGFGEDCGLISPALSTWHSSAVGPNSFLVQPLLAEARFLRLLGRRLPGTSPGLLVILLDISVIVGLWDSAAVHVFATSADCACVSRQFAPLLPEARECDSYATRLGCLVTGKAAELCISFPPSTTDDYDLLKQALLTGFSKNRQEFKCAKIRGFYISMTQEVATQGYASFQANRVPSCKARCVHDEVSQLWRGGPHSTTLPKNPRAFKDHLTPTTPQYKVRFCVEDRSVPGFTVAGTINGFWPSTIIRDTGCSGVVVSEEMLSDIDPSLFPKVKVSDYLGHVDEFPVVRCYLWCPFYMGCTDAVRAPIKFATALVGNIPGVNDPRQSNEEPPSDDSGQTEQDPIDTPAAATNKDDDLAFRMSWSFCC